MERAKISTIGHRASDDACHTCEMTEHSPFEPGLERRLDAEMRRELEAAEREAGKLAAKRRTIADVARSVVDRGDTVTVASDGLEFTGTGIYARGDLLTLRSRAALVEVNLGAIDWLRLEASVDTGGRSSPIEAESFAARLGLLELTAERVELVGRGGNPRVSGVIAAVARDHVVVDSADGKRWFLRLADIACALRVL